MSWSATRAAAWRQKIAAAIEAADTAFGYSISLTQLVDSVATYQLVMPDGTSEHDSHSAALDVALAARNRARADAILLSIDGPLTAAPAALKLAIDHIRHMAAWIGTTNAGTARGHYSFEALGEDMPGIEAALTATEPF
jgi:hypothetical protein